MNSNLIFFILCIASCQNATKTPARTLLISDSVPARSDVSRTVAPNTPKINCKGCFTVRPIKGSIEEVLKSPQVTRLNRDSFLNQVPEMKKVPFDSTVHAVIHFGTQQQIFFKSVCLEHLVNPETTHLESLYFIAREDPHCNLGAVQFKRTYKRKILNWGNIQIFEYVLDCVCNPYEPKAMILFVDIDHKNDYGAFRGLVFYTDSLRWKNYGNGSSIPLAINFPRKHPPVMIPLYYDGDKLIPLAYFRMKEDE